MPPPFQRLLDAHADSVLRFAAASVGRADADDVFQETFLAALRAYPDLRHHDNLRAWLLTIASRKALDHHRARTRRPVPVAAVGDGEAEPPAERPDDELWSAVRELPPRQREAVLLRYVGDLAHRDVAAALGCSEEAARRAAADGVARLRTEWSP